MSNSSLDLYMLQCSFRSSPLTIVYTSSGKNVLTLVKKFGMHHVCSSLTGQAPKKKSRKKEDLATVVSCLCQRTCS